MNTDSFKKTSSFSKKASSKRSLFKKALITGASSGIGEALANLFSKKGMTLILCGRNEEKLKEVASGKIIDEIVVADLQGDEGRQKVIAAVKKHLPDLIINNAGFGLYGEALSYSLEEQIALMEVNAKAPLEITLESARSLIAARKSGVILNVSSVAGEYITPGISIYGASKAFLTNFSRAFNHEVSQKGVKVLVCCPGMVDTEFKARAGGQRGKSRGPVMSAEFAALEIYKQALRHKEKRIISGVDRFLVFFTRYFIPTKLINKILFKRICNSLK